MSTIYCMIGIPGSGKSTVAEKISQEKGIPILESDKKRQELQLNTEKVSSREVFDALAKDAFKLIKAGKDFIWDATSTDPAYRRLAINNWKRNGARIEGLLMVVSKEIASQRNLKRDKKVPQEILDRYWQELINSAVDTESELFDEISIVNEEGQIMKVYDRELAREHKFEAKISPREFTPRPKMK